MALKNLAEADADELRKFLDSFDEVLCDCDGEYVGRNTVIVVEIVVFIDSGQVWAPPAIDFATSAFCLAI